MSHVYAHHKKVVCSDHLSLVRQNCHLSFGSICPVVYHYHAVFACTAFFSNPKLTSANHMNGFYDIGLN